MMIPANSLLASVAAPVAGFVILAMAPAVPAADTASRESAETTFAAPALEVGRPFPRIALPVVGTPADERRMLSIEAFHGERVVVHLFAGW